MKLTSIVGALIGGVAGALAWGALAKYLQLEVGYVAWGVGIFVGGLSWLAGGRGFANGGMCAILALAAMSAGKVLASKWSLTVEEAMAHAPASIRALSVEKRRAAAQKVIVRATWVDAVEQARDELNVIDIVFGALGVLTAIRLGGSKPDSDAGPMISINPYRADPRQSRKDPEQP